MNHLNFDENCGEVFHTLTLGLFKAAPKRNTKPSRMVCMKEKYQAIMDVIDHQDQDILLIKHALKQASEDSKASQLSQTKPSKQNADALVLLQKTRCTIHERHIELLSHLTALLNQYPNAEKIYSSNPDELDDYLHERETHHANVLLLVETYLPEAYQHISVTHLNHLHSSNLG